MTSRIEIAQKENLSIKEVHMKAEELNKTYFLDVFKSAHDGLWHGAVWKKQDCDECRKDECKGCVQRVLTFCEGFDRAHQAACDLNARIDGLHLTPDEEKKIGLSKNEISLLKKLQVRPSSRENNQAFQMKKSFERSLY